MTKRSKATTKRPSRSISRRKLILFRSVGVLLPFLAFALVETGWRLFSDEDRDPYVNISPFHLYERFESDGAVYARISHKLAYAQDKVEFPIRKPAGTFRMFCVGGSACAGWPLLNEQRFSAYLERSLQDVLPERRVEVINASAHGFASYRVRRFFDELLELDPDAILVYSGNNEFLEKRKYAAFDLPVIGRLAGKLKTVQWLQSRLAGPKTDLSGDELRDTARFFHQKIKRQALEIRSDPDQFANVIAHYHHSIEHMARRAAEAGTPVLLCTVPVNQRDWLPIVSHNGLTGRALDEWQEACDLGMKGVLEGNRAEGIRHMSRAIELEPEHAESQFWLGRLREPDDPPGARECYQAACDLDYNPFRAISAFSDAVRSIADDYPSVHLVDLEKAFDRAAVHPAPGFDLFLDYVHPNTRGHLLITEEIFGVMAGHGLLPRPVSPDDFSRAGLAKDKSGKPYEAARDPAVQTLMCGLFIRNHQHHAAVEKIESLYRLATGNDLVPGARFPANWPPELTEGYDVLHEYLTLRKKRLLGADVSPKAVEEAKRKLDAYYEEKFPYGTF